MKHLTKHIQFPTLLCIAVFSLSGTAFSQYEPPSAAGQLGWRLGMQAYSFKEFTFFEAIDKNAAMGMKVIEAYSKQTVSKDIPEKTGIDMSPALRKKIKDKLKSKGVKLVNYGVYNAKSDEEWRKLFEFAKDMGIETIVSEPDPKFMDLIEKLCEEFQTNLAIHNHPKPSRYWNPETVLEAVKGRGPRIGACADTGHWARSGLDPLECLKKLEGRIISLHFKDLNEFGVREAHDMPWGTGVCNSYSLLAELRRQDFRGVFSVEYEHNWLNSVPEITKCAEYFNLISDVFVEDGFEPLGDESLYDAIYEPGGWVVEDDVLISKGKGDIWTKAKYGDFILNLEFKCEDKTNSGVFIRTKDVKQWLHTGIEVQILQGDSSNKKHITGGIFDCLAPKKNNIREPGEWNHYLIVAKANNIYVILNGEQVTHMDLDLWTEAHKNPDGTKNKFNNAYKDMARVGHIGFQYHGHPIEFRNLAIKPLSPIKY